MMLSDLLKRLGEIYAEKGDAVVELVDITDDPVCVSLGPVTGVSISEECVEILTDEKEWRDE